MASQKKFKTDDLPLKTFAKADNSNASALVFADSVGYCESDRSGMAEILLPDTLKKETIITKHAVKEKW